MAPPPGYGRSKEMACCRHCGKKRSMNGRGLCRRCHRNLFVRALYQSPLPRGRRAPEPDANRSAPLPAAPTSALPGTEEKVELMRERVRRGFRPCHPLDARGCKDSRGPDGAGAGVPLRKWVAEQLGKRRWTAAQLQRLNGALATLSWRPTVPPCA